MQAQYTTARNPIVAQYDPAEHCWTVVDDEEEQYYCFDTKRQALTWQRELTARRAEVSRC